MGTRSLTVVKDEDMEILTMYRQMDGYPSCHGQAVADFLSGKQMTNGLPLGETEHLFNGMGCLAASLVAHFKKGAGGIYIEPPGARDCGEEYIYTIRNRNGKIWLTVQSGSMAFFGLPGTKQENMNILFEGPVENFSVAACELAEKGQPPPPNDFLNEQKNKD